MGDLALLWDADIGAADLALEDDDVATEEGLRTAVMISLFTDRRADDSDTLPSGDDDRRGWWGDNLEEVENDRVGARLWLLTRAKILPGFAARVEAMVREALAWMLDDRVATTIDVGVEVVAPVLSLVITIYRPSGDEVSFRFAHVWDGEAANAV